MGLINQALLATLLLSGLALGNTGAHASPLAARQEAQPCALVRAAQQQQLRTERRATVFYVTAQLAHDCLSTVPFKKNDALRLIDGLGAFWQWQSTLDYLKAPPKGYQLPATDIHSRLASIRNKAATNQYDNEYVFQSDLNELAISTHDGHFNLMLDALGVFTFRREAIGGIVSLSSNGEALPEPYVQGDLLASARGGWTPSAIRTIDGKPAAEWLEKFSYTGLNQDPDALYNEVFYTMAAETGGRLGNFFATTGQYTGPTTTLGFANGTTTEYENTAAFTDSFENVVDGESFYSVLCSGQLPSNPRRRKRDVPMTPPRPRIVQRAAGSPPRAAYPSPVVELESGEVAGYFVDDDTAVLSISAFLAGEQQQDQRFSQVITAFLNQCQKSGKTKLIIDVTSNGGGAIFLGYDAFKQLFPDAEITDAFNLRATEQLLLMGNKAYDVLKDPSTKNTNAAQLFSGSMFDLETYLDVNDRQYESWKDFFGPENIREGDFTHPARWNFHDREASLSAGLIVSGFLSRSDLPPQVFKPENMILLTDGTCGSTCTIFGSLLKANGVRSIAIGGRPRNGPMQALGGVRGTHVLSFSAIYQYASSLLNDFSTSQERRRLENTDIGEIVRDGPYVLARSLGDGEGARVNMRNAIKPDDPDRMALQFTYEPADCRIWFTPEMVLDIRALWSVVAETAWGGRKCTPASTRS